MLCLRRFGTKSLYIYIISHYIFEHLLSATTTINHNHAKYEHSEMGVSFLTRNSYRKANQNRFGLLTNQSRVDL